MGPILFCCRFRVVCPNNFIKEPYGLVLRTRTVNAMSKSRESHAALKRKAALWLRQGISPPRLALTLALGFAIGCIPVVGIPTVLCAGLALMLRLNLPAIQAANYAVMPLQLLLIVPFVRLGGWLFPAGLNHTAKVSDLLHGSPLALLSQLGGLAGHAMLGWAVIAVPAVALMTATLTVVLRQIPALAAVEACD
jgi:uncharacterized protein (DUF2062 family)